MNIKPLLPSSGIGLNMMQPDTSLSGPAASAGSDFGAMLAQVATDATKSVQSAEAASIRGIQGTMPVQDVVNQLMAAERNLQTVISVRDKVVSAYQELGRMAI